MSSHTPIENTPMNDFENKANEILISKFNLELDDSQNNAGYTFNQEYLVDRELKEAVEALLHLHQQEMLKVIGEDEKAATPASPVMKQIFPNYIRIDYRNELREQQRTNLNNTIKGDK